jgi:hypothetical protein
MTAGPGKTPHGDVRIQLPFRVIECVANLWMCIVFQSSRGEVPH